MGLKGKLISQIDIKSDGDVFHEIFRERPHHISGMSPDHIQNYGKKEVAKEIIEAIDEEKKSVTFKVIEGDLMQLYKTFTVTVLVDTSGEDNLVTWTVDYEKLSDDVPHPHMIMDLLLNMTKDIETHHLS
ncbi:hypothetical protein DH2020_032088 [Rehmannia glutinosa]|uniref:Bet v I/Major latex protein domain-containing protein n=1 Tax=Rehmannia glutinosa TaxID=99300 RepID=A0ABR0VG50_REHGL